MLVCCTLVVLSSYISISPDKEAGWLWGREIESVAFYSIMDSTAFFRDLTAIQRGVEETTAPWRTLTAPECFEIAVNVPCWQLSLGSTGELVHMKTGSCDPWCSKHAHGPSNPSHQLFSVKMSFVSVSRRWCLDRAETTQSVETWLR